MKFGGTSMGSADSIKNVVSIIQGQLAKGTVTVVVSAVSGTTDKLIALANAAISSENHIHEKLEEIKQTHSQIIAQLGIENTTEQLFKTLEDFVNGIKQIKELSPHSFDYISSYGERLSATILAQYLNKVGITSEAIMADTFLITTPEPGKADPIIEQSHLTVPAGVTPVITGFLGRSTDNKITTLGRGGSDYSASAVGAILKADEIQIWTDVSGIYTTDPRICSHAKPHHIISFREASEMARFGAKVIHPQTMVPAMENQIPIFIKNTFHPEDQGTEIAFDESRVPNDIKAITIKKGVTLITVETPEMLLMWGFFAQVATIFGKHGIPMDVLASSEISISTSIETDDISDLVQDLEELGNVIIDKNQCIICVVGQGLKKNLRTNAKILEALSELDLEAKVISQGAPQNNFSLILPESAAVEAVNKIHDTVFKH